MTEPRIFSILRDYETVVATELEGSGLTAADFAQLPEGPPYYQLINGDLYMSPRPRRKHQGILAKLMNRLGPHIEERKLGKIYFAPSDVVLNDTNVFNPDIYFVSNARRDRLTEQGCSGAPDLVVEVLSKSTAKLDLGKFTPKPALSKCGSSHPKPRPSTSCVCRRMR